ncbi:hypothetical protein CS063_01605 [Sporanaerobium hydrogeniformans]|uniref:Uncharacterized protein n=1 Tax=Sporanaerobium hydrogeniformans TaxID=3072179 RepID=A0AC61DG89_9FIRM|nr:hypothetical protein [Sporanaerobium hydrogeniformans]PHV72196.1 hypothetical protein CS063_01605 [Sporanaerobium hydrogeniformans]
MFDLILAIVQVVFLVVVVLAIPWIKKNVPSMVTVILVNVAETLFSYANAGPDKFAWVDKLLQQLLPKLTALEREQLIEDIVTKMNAIGEALK